MEKSGIFSLKKNQTFAFIWGNKHLYLTGKTNEWMFVNQYKVSLDICVYIYVCFILDLIVLLREK